MKQSCLILLLISSCTFKSQSHCKIDSLFKNNFENCLKIASSLNYDFEDFAHHSDVYKAYACLRAITKVESLVINGGDISIHYAERDGLKKDLKNWEKWYEDNKCNYTNAMALELLDSLEKQRKSEYLNDSLTQIMMKKDTFLYNYVHDDYYTFPREYSISKLDSNFE